MALSAEQKAVLDFERGWWQLPGPKERDIRELLNLSASRYYRVLTEALSSSDAMAYDPLVVRRLLRTRDLRRRARFGTAGAAGPPGP